MAKYLGYFHVYENCYHSTYGKKKAMEYAEPFYCVEGVQYETRTGRKVNTPLCHDWPKCRGLGR